jgi:hypothetical protein
MVKFNDPLALCFNGGGVGEIREVVIIHSMVRISRKL